MFEAQKQEPYKKILFLFYFLRLYFVLRTRPTRPTRPKISTSKRIARVELVGEEIPYMDWFVYGRFVSSSRTDLRKSRSLPALPALNVLPFLGIVRVIFTV